MIERHRLAAWVLMAVGVVLVVGIPEVIEGSASTAVLLGLSVAGGVLLWAGAIWDDTLCRAERDERVAEIHYRAGYNTALAFGALNGMVIFVTTNLDMRVSVTAIAATLGAGLAVYFGSVAWLRRTM